MKQLLTLALIAFLFTTLPGCRKLEDKVFNAFFYTKQTNPKVPLTLFLNDQPIGALPPVSGKTECRNDSLKLKMLAYTVHSGKHKIEAKDNQGIVRSSSIITIDEGSLSSRGIAGGTEASVTGSCLFVGVFY
ncbi:hypothetical protein [Adhaeribacter soli]|uniref:DUF4397 domain-containing protein n=1 Tax=Adhaeribacter soli TaxID=2607655 RepID=A0A5N1IS37_9BACT|nr:hypothetical protein [Adhaeribacter soli]KAA9331773.1 hypothetical protein F0P94_13260 [Adhaeribacter soli]